MDGETERRPRGSGVTHDAIETIRELMAEVYPDVPVRDEVDGFATLLSIAKARRLLGYEPQFSWRDRLKG